MRVRNFHALFGKRYAAAWHFVSAVFVFSDFFLRGKILVSSSDIVDYQLPLWETARQNFLSGDLGLWNSSILNGISLFSMGLTPIFYPENWLLFLVPQKYFFLGLTFAAFVKLWLIGFFGYLWFQRELRHRGWALFASIVYQLCGFSIWAVAASNLLTLQCYLTISLYLVWSSADRSPLKNYILLTLVGIQLFYCANLVYEVYAIGLLLIFSFYRDWNDVRKFFPVALAVVTCALLAMPRWLPSWYEIHESSRFATYVAGNFEELGFLLSRLFVPEIFGVSFWAAFNTIKELSPQFEQLNVQTHSHFPQFFGAVAALLAVVGWITGAFPRRARFWATFTLVVLALLCMLQPLSLAFRELAHPVYHLQSLQIWLPATFALFAAYVGRSLQRNPKPLRERLGSLQFVLALVLLYSFTIATFSFQKEWNLHWAWKAAAILTVALSLWRPRLGWRALAVFGAAVMAINPSANPIHLSHVRELGLTLVALGLALGWTWSRRAYVALAVTFVVLAILFGVNREMFQLATRGETTYLAILGLVKFVVLASLAWKIVHGARRWVLPGLCLLTAADLLPAAKIHTHLAMNPFWKEADPFPGVESFGAYPVRFDPQNYRFNYPNTFLASPLYRALYGSKEIPSSYFSAYGIRSYSGINNIVGRNYDRFLKTLLAPSYPSDYRDNGERGLAGTETNERFLDLVGVRYDFRPEQGHFRERTSALSRFVLFHEYEVFPEEKKLAVRLLDKTWSPQRTVLVEKALGLRAIAAPSQVLHARQDRSDILSLDILSHGDAIVLFNDSYHPGWTVTVDGEPREVLRANHNFMAVKVPSGRSLVRFEFVPPYFALGLRLAAMGLCFFVLVCAVGFKRREFRLRAKLRPEFVS